MTTTEHTMNGGGKQRGMRFKTKALIAFGAFILIMAAMVYLMRKTTVVLFNETGQTFSTLTIEACGQKRTFKAVDNEMSLEFQLAPNHAVSEVQVFTNGCDLAMWHGGYLQADVGHRMFIRLKRNGQVESYRTVSVLHRLLHGSEDADN